MSITTSQRVIMSTQDNGRTPLRVPGASISVRSADEADKDQRLKENNHREVDEAPDLEAESTESTGAEPEDEAAQEQTMLECARNEGVRFDGSRLMVLH